MPGLVCQTNRKNRGKLPKALTRSFQVSGSTADEGLGLIGEIYVE